MFGARIGRAAAHGIAGAAVAVFLLAPLAALPILAATAQVTIGDALEPATLQVVPGTTVTWTNASGDRHRMRSTSGPTEFDSGDLDPGQSFSVTFTTTGTWQYRDERNKDLSNYWGTIIVADAVTPQPSASSGATPPPTAPPVDILMAGRAFSPRTLTVDAGTAVRWRNDDTREHTVTANDRSFDSGLLAVGATFTRVFSTPGTYAYLCLIHPDMTGTIAVRGLGGATPPPPSSPTPVPPQTPAPTPGPATGDVVVVDFAFNPASIDVVAGTTVTWVNGGAALHTVTASDGAWDSGLIAAGGGRFSRRFGAAGTYPYLCALHPSMTGVVRVSSAAGGAPPPPASATPPPVAPSAAAGELELRDFAFVPSDIRVVPGTTLTWVNTGAAPHTVTDRAGAFDSGLLVRGARWSRTFATPGTFRLLCSIHPDMRATLVVAAPGATAPPPATLPPAATPPPGSGAVAIVDFDFAPQVLEVSTGTTVTWMNRGVAPHTVTATDGGFDSGFLSAGDSYSRTFTAAGSFEYLCAIHPAMTGSVVVTGATGGTGLVGAAPGVSPQPGVLAGGGDAPAGATDPGGGGVATAAPARSTSLTTESVARLVLAGALWAVAIGMFLGLIRSTLRRA
jgi:plastocyanin